MIDMEVSMEGNGPSQVHQQVPSSPGLDANVIIEINESNKMTPQGLCRRLVSAHQEMEVIDEILTSAKKSDFQNDYLELNANLSKKKEYLLKWVSRFGICPIAECKIHHADLKPNQSKTTTKRAASEISSHNDQANSSKDFKKPNRKHTAKANFISARPHHNDVIWGFFLRVKLTDMGTIDVRTLKLLWLGDGKNSI
ncbi:hypothetical protein CDAR_518341 [Caerostris darwini]|uniref:Uncharacterized protein n=1 Tax=Caerostris darwini TaxID=1538125 RepID=A0AAV4QZ79_9ARAC|nr:hypothetical protein CDAR_518341 [Caerostris darwini]